MKIRNNSNHPLVVADVKVQPHEVREVRGDVWARMKAERPEFAEAVAEGVYEELAHLLPGDGSPGCQLCLGRGFISEGVVGRRCTCVRTRDVIANVNKIWPMYQLIKADKLPKGHRSPLMDFVDRNLYITAPEDLFKAHLRATAIRQGSDWYARVRGDNDLLRAWFFTAKAKGVEIYDVDVADSPISEDPSIEDLALPPDLLIVLMGVKRTRNVASPETLLEVLKLREFRSKPTWIVDQPNYLLTSDFHLFNEAAITTILEAWNHVELTRHMPVVSQTDPDDILAASSSPSATVTAPTAKPARPGKITLSSQVGADRGRTKSEDIVETEEPWKPGKPSTSSKRGKGK